MENKLEDVDMEPTKELEQMEEYHDEFHDKDVLDYSSDPSPSCRSQQRGIVCGVFTVAVMLILFFKSASHHESAPSPVVTATATATTNRGDETNTPSTTTSSIATSTPTSAPTKFYNVHGCVYSDRFDNEHNYQHNHLYPGQFICSRNHTNQNEEHHRYRFGVTKQGHLVLRDTLIPDSNTYHYNRVLYHNKNTTVDESYYFSLLTDGTFVLNYNDNQHWTSEPNRPMHLTPLCLEEHDCPYLHLHAGGVLVVNYIEDGNTWQQKNILHVYDSI